MKTYVVAILIASFFVSAQGLADSSFPEENQKLEATAQVALRASSPDASFGTKGERIGWILQGESVRVVSAKQHMTVFGLEVWVEVESTKHAAVKGWVFNGMSGEVLQGKGKLQATTPTALVAQLH